VLRESEREREGKREREREKERERERERAMSNQAWFSKKTVKQTTPKQTTTKQTTTTNKPPNKQQTNNSSFLNFIKSTQKFTPKISPKNKTYISKNAFNLPIVNKPLGTFFTTTVSDVFIISSLASQPPLSAVFLFFVPSIPSGCPKRHSS